ncbi:MAG TPA: hypothetical protein VF645_05605 [Allosphingosinicella sp.]|jgi:hypothetical protein
MTENEGGRTAGPGGAPEPIQDDRDGGDPAVKGDPPSTGAGDDSPAGDGQAAIDLEAVRDRAS